MNDPNPFAPCADTPALKKWIAGHTGLTIPTEAVCHGHSAPFEYINHIYFQPTKDVIVWAPRGGGKTRLGALATLLDLLHKPGCSVRILGGSFEQSLKMWEHLLPDVEEIASGLLLNRRAVGRQIRLTNRSMAAVLTQSQRAVRGLRVQKLRCDEVELFDPQVWEAAQLVTRSIRDSNSGQMFGGVVEAISTLHRSHGLMHRIIESARKTGTRIIRWCLLDVLERCPPERQCATCPLVSECGGLAKTHCNGFVRIDDAIAMKNRVSVETWEAEMLCRRPSTTGRVFPTFEPETHVREQVRMDEGATISLAIDFGFHAPFVCLWVRDDGGTCHVLDEFVQPGQTVMDHVEHLEARQWGRIRRICCDPAGTSRNDQTAESNVTFLKRRGYKVCTKHSRIIEGLELMRAALRTGAGEVKLFIHPRCTKLIEAMREYHYPDGGGELPVKDGVNDHPIDALRYFYVNRSRTPVTIASRPY